MDNTNMVGHIVVPQKRVEVTPGFAGINGNLLWVNTGGSALLLNIETCEDTRSILMKPGFRFCLGKRDQYARMFVSSLDCIDDLFIQSECTSRRPHAIFFGSDKGDVESWRCALNIEVPAPEYSKKNLKKIIEKVKIKVDERYRRLGIELRNNKRNHIRIAPMKGCDMPKNFLSQKIAVVERWVKNTLRQAKLSSIPARFAVVKEMEHPQDGDPFEVLWVKFDFDENMWNDEVMWDIRWLLMGTKMEKLPGFPSDLSCVREKIYISRDGDSERKRRVERV